MILEAGELIHDDGIEVKRDAALLYQPLYIFPVDDIDICRTLESCFSLFFCANRNRIGQYLKVIPFLNLCWPCIPCHTERCNYQNAVRDEAVKQKIK